MQPVQIIQSSEFGQMMKQCRPRSEGPAGSIQFSILPTSFSNSTFEPRHEETNIWFSTRCDINWAAQLQKMARGLKFRI